MLKQNEHSLWPVLAFVLLKTMTTSRLFQTFINIFQGSMYMMYKEARRKLGLFHQRNRRLLEGLTEVFYSLK